MREIKNAFHLAIPAFDLAQAEDFYVQQLGCQLARRYDDRITLNFFGDQVVCHLTATAEPSTKELDLYPRHFGITFHDRDDFEALHLRCLRRKIRMFRDVQERFSGKTEVHLTFVLRDPSDNLIEFKYYADPSMMY